MTDLMLPRKPERRLMLRWTRLPGPEPDENLP